MKISILSIGNELLSGKTMNTNANWLGNRLTKIGCRMEKQVVVPDKEKPIINALNFLVNDNWVYFFTNRKFSSTKKNFICSSSIFLHGDIINCI